MIFQVNSCSDWSVKVTCLSAANVSSQIIVKACKKTTEISCKNMTLTQSKMYFCVWYILILKHFFRVWKCRSFDMNPSLFLYALFSQSGEYIWITCFWDSIMPSKPILWKKHIFICLDHLSIKLQCNLKIKVQVSFIVDFDIYNSNTCNLHQSYFGFAFF